MSSIAKDLGTIRKMGIKALIEKLGPVGMVEFIRQFDPVMAIIPKNAMNGLMT